MKLTLKYYLIYGIIGLLILSCKKNDLVSIEMIAQADLEAQAQRKNQKMRMMQLMATELPLYRTLPVEGLAQTDTMLLQGDLVRILDERTYTDDRKKAYFYVEVASSGLKGYVLQEYLIDEHYRMGLTSRYTTHYFQPDNRTGASSTIFLPAYTAIFSDDQQGKSAFIAYYGVDLYGSPLKGYLERDAVLFAPNLLRAYSLYRQAFFSNSIQQQMQFVNQIKREYANTPFAKLGDDLLNVRNLSDYGRDLRLFDQGYRAKRSTRIKDEVIPLYSQPSEQATVLGYITDERFLALTAGYGQNPDLTEIESPFGWYLVDLYGWVKAEHITLFENISQRSQLGDSLLDSDNQVSNDAIEGDGDEIVINEEESV